MAGGKSIATAWVSIVPDTSQIAPKLAKAFRDAQDPAKQAGRKAGEQFQSSFTNPLKKLVGSAKSSLDDSAKAAGEAGAKAGKNWVARFASETKNVSKPLVEAGSKAADGIGKALKVGVVGAAATAGAAAGATLGVAISKGFKRLSDIESARATLTGLGHDAERIEEIMASASASVKGTAYGLGEAGKIAASAVAAGVKPGEDLTRTLTLVADAAAVANRPMGEMGSIFNKVAASGKVQGDVLNQLSDSGIPIVQLLGEELGVTTDRVFEMARKGQINFDIFRNALEKGLGGSAQAMGNTFAGSLANVGAALSRTGEMLLKPAFTAAPQVFRSITAVIDSLNSALKPVAEKIGERLTPMFEQMAVIIETRLGPRIEQLAVRFGEFLVADGGGIDRITAFFAGLSIPEGMGESLQKIVGSVMSLVPAAMSLAGAVAPIIAPAAAGMWQAISSAIETIVPLIQSIVGVAVPVFDTIGEWAKSDPEAVRSLAAGITTLILAMKGFSAAAKAITAARVAFVALKAVMLANPFGVAIAALGALTAAAIWFFTKTEAGKKIMEDVAKAFAISWENAKITVKKIWDWIVSAFTAVWEWIKNKISENVEFWAAEFNGFKEDVKRIFTALKDGIVEKFTAAIDWIASVPSKIKEKFSDAGSMLLDIGKQIIQGLWDGLKSKWEAVKNWFGSVKNTIANAFSGATAPAPAPANGGGVRRFASGGRLPTRGPGTGIVDGFLGVDRRGMAIARVNAGEWVINARASKKYHRLLAAINSGRLRLPGYATGGVVGGGAALEGDSRALGMAAAAMGKAAVAMNRVADNPGNVHVDLSDVSVNPEQLGVRGFIPGIAESIHSSIANGMSVLATLKAGQWVEIGEKLGLGLYTNMVKGVVSAQEKVNDSWKQYADAQAQVGEAQKKHDQAWKKVTEARAKQGEQAGKVAAAEKALEEARRKHQESMAQNVSMTVAQQHRLDNALRAVEKAKRPDKKGVVNSQRVADAEHRLAQVRESISAQLEQAGSKQSATADKAAEAVKKAEEKLAAARSNASQAAEKTSEAIAATADTAKATSAAMSAASAAALAAGQAQIAVAIEVFNAVVKVIDHVISSLTGSIVAVRNAVAESAKATQEHAQLIAKQREMVALLRYQAAMATIDVVAAARKLRFAQLDGLRDQLESVKTVASARAKLEAQRKKDARLQLADYTDLSLEINRFRFNMKDAVVGGLVDLSVWSDESRALFAEVQAAQIGQQIAAKSAAINNLKAAYEHTKAVLDLQDATRSLSVASEKLAAMTENAFGLDPTQATVGQRYAALQAEKAKISAEKASPKSWLNPAAWFTYYPAADRRIKQINRELAELEAREEFKGFSRKERGTINRMVGSAGFLGLFGGTDKIESMIRNSALGDAQRSLDKARFETQLIDVKNQQNELRAQLNRKQQELNYRSVLDPLETQLKALEARQGSEKAWADYWRESDAGVREAIRYLAVHQERSADELQRAASTNQVVNITLPSSGHMVDADAISDMFTRLDETQSAIDLRVTRLEAPPVRAAELAKSRRFV